MQNSSGDGKKVTDQEICIEQECVCGKVRVLPMYKAESVGEISR
jgi:hypothetical protein